MKSKEILGVVVGASIAAGIAFSAIVVASCLRLVAPPVVPITSVAALVASVALVIVGRKATPRVVTSAAIGLILSLVPSLVLGTAWALSEPLASTATRCGTGDIGLPFLTLVLLFLGSMIAIPVALAAIHVARIAGRVAIVLSASVLVAGIVVAVLGGMSLRRPEPDAYEKLFVTSMIAPGEHVDFANVSFAYDPAVHPAKVLGERRCTLTSTRSGVSTDTAVDATLDACPTVHLYADTRSDIVIVSSHELSRPDAILGETTSYGNRELAISDFRGRLGAPRGWVVGAVIGLVLAAIALGFAFRARRRARDASRAIEGEHTGAGWTTFGGAPRFVPELAATSPGPVVRSSDADEKPPTYRDDGAPQMVVAVPGSRESLRASENERTLAWAAIAIAIVAMTSAPLWVARLDGLL